MFCWVALRCFIFRFAYWFGTENPGCSVVLDMIIWFDSVLGLIAIFLWLGGFFLVNSNYIILMLTIANIYSDVWTYHVSTHMCIVLMPV